MHHHSQIRELFTHTHYNTPYWETLRTLKALDYRAMLVDEQCGVMSDCRNIICVPQERSAELPKRVIEETNERTAKHDELSLMAPRQPIADARIMVATPFCRCQLSQILVWQRVSTLIIQAFTFCGARGSLPWLSPSVVLVAYPA